MRYLLLIALFPTLAFSQWSSEGTIGKNIDKNNDTDIILEVTQAVATGNVVVIAIAKDNSGTTDGDLDEITSVTDTKSNTWVQAVDYTHGSCGAAAQCSGVGIFYSDITSALTTSDTITVNFSANAGAKAVSGWEFSMAGGASYTVTLADIDTAGYSQGTNLGSLDGAGLASSTEYLWFRADAWEQPHGGTYTNTTNFTALPDTGTTGGGSQSNMSVFGEFRIFTGTSNASDPELATDADKCSGYAILLETAPGEATRRVIIVN